MAQLRAAFQLLTCQAMRLDLRDNTHDHKKVPAGSTVGDQHATWLKPGCWDIVDSLDGQRAGAEARVRYSAEDLNCMEKYSMVAYHFQSLPDRGRALPGERDGHWKKPCLSPELKWGRSFLPIAVAAASAWTASQTGAL